MNHYKDLIFVSTGPMMATTLNVSAIDSIKIHVLIIYSLIIQHPTSCYFFKMFTSIPKLNSFSHLPQEDSTYNQKPSKLLYTLNYNQLYSILKHIKPYWTYWILKWQDRSKIIESLLMKKRILSLTLQIKISSPWLL